MNRFNTNEDKELNNHRDFVESVIDSLHEEVAVNLESSGKLDEYLEKLYQRYDNDISGHIFAEKVIKRAYRLFHHNAQNRWRRWDYVKPKVGQMVIIINDYYQSAPKPIFINNERIKFYNSKKKMCYRWYPIPEWK